MLYSFKTNKKVTMAVVANPEGYIKNVIKKGTAKDVSRLCYSLCKTYQKQPLDKTIDNESKESLLRLIQTRDCMFINMDMMEFAQAVYEVVHGDRNKVTVGRRTYIVQKKNIPPQSEKGVYHVSEADASFVFQYLAVFYLKQIFSKTCPETINYAIGGSKVVDAFRLVTIPKNHSKEFFVSKTHYAGVPITLVEKSPIGYEFVEFSCFEDGWHAACGIYVGDRCDIFIDDAVLTVRILLMLHHMCDQEIHFIQSTLHHAELIFKKLYGHDPMVSVGRTNGDLVTFMFSVPETDTTTTKKKSKKKNNKKK